MSSTNERQPLLSGADQVLASQPYDAPILEESLEEASHNKANTVAAEKWNDPPENVLKVVVTFIGFICLGLTDAAIGPLIPSLEEHYQLTDAMMSVPLLLPSFGYLISAFCSGWVHYQIGRGGVSILAVILMLTNYLIALTEPPFYGLIAGYTLGGIGSGLANGSWNAWIGAMQDSHRILGIFQGFYALGGIAGPAILTFFLQSNLRWSHYYVLLATLQVIVLILAVIAFRGDNAQVYRQHMQDNDEDDPDSDTSETVTSFDAIRSKKVWLFSAILMAYNGLEMSVSNWGVTFMIRKRHGDPKTMGLISSSLWAGLAFGRVGLGFVTGSFRSLKVVVAWYLILGFACHLTFWAFEDILTSFIAIFGLGFFIGPMFPSAMIMATLVLPKKLHVPGISAASSMSGVGSSSFPVILGNLIEHVGAGALPPFTAACFVSLIVLWCSLPVKR